MRRNSWISVFASSMIAGLPIVGALTVAPIATAADTAGNTAANDAAPSSSAQSLFDAVTSTTATDTQRLNGAVDLLNLAPETTRPMVLQGLSKNANAAGRVALERAITAEAKPDPAYILPLGALLGINAKETKSVAAALVNYRGDAAALNQLQTFIDQVNNPADSRIEAARVMGTLIDKEAARYLVSLVSAPNQTQSIRDAAAAALAQMTGLTSNGSNSAQWQQWWAGVAALNAREFHGSLMEGRAREAAVVQQLQAAFADLLNNDYYSAPTEARKAELVLKYLNSDSPIVRLAVVELVNQNLENHPPTAEIKNRLVEMISDADEKVRLSAVDVLRDSTKLKDAPDLLPRLTARLQVEKSAQVKIHILQALGKFGLSRGGDAVAGLLTDPDVEVKTAAAKALSGNLGTNYRHDNTAGSNAASAVLSKIIDDNKGHPGTEELRAACVGAIVTLQGSAAFNQLILLVDDGESAEVRKAALQGLGILGNPRANEIVARVLDNTRDPSIRLEAARALRSVARPEDSYRIFQKMRSDLDPVVRQALWLALYKLYDQLPVDDLVRYADLFNRPPDKDPDKRLATLVKLGDAYKAKGQSELYARNLQDVAQAMMEVTPAQSAEAIKDLREALKYWRDTGKDMPLLLQGLIGDLLDDLLKSAQYADAAKFAAEQIAIKPEYQQQVGPRIKNKADELSRSDPAGAKTLIDEALKMSPPLEDKYVTQLQQIQEEMKRQHP